MIIRSSTGEPSERRAKMAIVLYDLVGQDDRRFSPHCWRTRMALAHKGLECEARPTRFTDIPRIEDGRVKTVPAIRDGERLVVDSWAIARDLEERYPDRPSLFGGPGGLAATRFVQSWCTTVLHAGLIGLDHRRHLGASLPRGPGLLSDQPGKALRTAARGGPGRARDAGRGLPQEPAAAPPDAEGCALAWRRHAALRRLSGVRRAAVGALHQPVPGPDRGRSDPGLVRALPGPPRRARPAGASRIAHDCRARAIAEPGRTRCSNGRDRCRCRHAQGFWLSRSTLPLGSTIWTLTGPL